MRPLFTAPFIIAPSIVGALWAFAFHASVAADSAAAVKEAPESHDLLIVSSHQQVSDGKDYDSVIVVGGHLDFAGRSDTLVVLGGKAVLKKGSHIRDTVVVIAGSIDQEEGALLPEDGIRSLSDPGFNETSPWKKTLKDKFFGLWSGSWDSSKVSSFLSPFAFIFKTALLAIAFLMMLALILIAPKITEAPERLLREQPWRSCLVGMIAFLGFFPACLVLALTIVGILVIPFLAFAYLLASIAGILAVMSSIGSIIVGSSTSRWISGLVGFIAFMGAAMIPFMGLWVVFTLSAAGAGATILAWIQRRQNIVTVNNYTSYQI